MTNEDFLGQIPAHPDAIQDDVEKDYGTDFSLELAVSDNDDSTWLPDLGVGGGVPRPPGRDSRQGRRSQ